MLSSYLSLDMKDILSWCILAVTGAVLAGLLDLLNVFTSGWTLVRHQLALVAAAGGIAGITYLIKRLFSNNIGQLFTEDVTKVTLPPTPTV